MNYDRVTQRELLAVIGSVPRTVLGTMQSRWHETGHYANKLADTIEQRLTTLTSPDGGWTGPGADAFAATIRSELVANLRSYALHAAGIHPQGVQHTGYDSQVGRVLDAVDGSHTTAGQNGVPWDSDTTWQLPGEPAKPDPDAPKPPPGTPAPAPEPAKIRNGHGGVVKELDQDRWDGIRKTHPAQPVPAIYAAANVKVTTAVHHLDLLLEAVPLNTDVKSQCRQAVTTVVNALDTFAPPPAKGTVTTSTTNYAQGAKTPGTPTNTPTTPPSTPTGPGPTTPTDPNGPTGPGGPGDDPAPPTHPTGPIDGPISDPPGGHVGDPIGYPPGGPSGGPIGGPPAAPPGYPDSGTVGAGLPTGGSGGIGAPTFAGPSVATVPVGSPGTGGLGGFGGGIAVPNSSFSSGGPGGRGLANPGSAPSSLSGAGSGGSGAGAGHGGSGGAVGTAPVRRGGSGSDEEGAGEDFDGTWLEEDQSVWGNRAGAPPSTIG